MAAHPKEAPMATVRPPRPAPTAKYDAFVEGQLDRARRRIRVLDVASALLLFLVGTLAYLLIVGFLDRKLDLSPFVRQLAFAGYALASLAFLGVAVVRPLCRHINPYFAARAVEGVVPGSKNSLVNWLDLHDESLPAAIRASLGQRAARDLARADLEQAISGRRAIVLTAVTAGFALAVFVLLLSSGAGGFATLLARAFAPFGGGATVRHTQLTLVRPTTGDAVIGVGQSFNVAVQVDGRVPDPDRPDALKLLYRYRDGEPYEEQPLDPETGDLWATVVPPSRTFNGFHYKVVGGDASTPEFRVTVRGTPLVERFDVTYHYRKYTGCSDDHSRDANLRALRGTEAELLIHTNRPVKEGRLEVETKDGKRDVLAELVPGDAQAMRARLVIEENGHYRVWFKSADGDSNAAAMPYTIQADADLPPKAELTKPAADVTLPANGTLRLEGSASDDIGVKEVTLRLRLPDGTALAPKPYREGKSFQLADGGYPKSIGYQDFVALDQLKDSQGKPFPPAKDMVLEYWLEAADACDYPAPNRAESKHYKVTIAEATPDPQQKQERQQAADEKKKHDREQDQRLKQEEQRRQEEAREKAKEQQKDGQQPGDQTGGKPEQANGPNDRSLDQKAQQAKDALDRKQKDEQREGEKGQGKGPQDGKGEAKGEGQSGQRPDQDQAQNKPEGQNGNGQEGAAKGEGKDEDGQRPDTGAGKPEGAQPQDAKSSEGKGQGQGDQQPAASAKKDGAPQPDKGDTKGQGQDDMGQSAAAKERANGPDGMKDDAVAKGPGQEQAGDKATAKGDQPAVAQGERKPGEAGGEPRAERKGEGQPQGGAERAEAKGGDGSRAQGEPKDDPNKRGLASELKRREGEARRGTEQESAEAEKWLEDLARNAKDRDVRELAQKVLDDARKDRASSPALPKGPPRDDANDGPPAEGKGGNGNGTSAAKAGGQEAGDGKPGGQAGVAQGAGRTTGEGRPNGSTSVGPGEEGRLQGLHADEAQPSPADVAHRQRPGVLQVEDFTKIDKDILKDLQMSPEEWEAFKKAYAEKLRREAPEQLPNPGNDRIGSRGASERKIDKSGTSGDRTGLGQAPSEFRGPFRDYTKRQAEKK
jgi:hypothetical protein